MNDKPKEARGFSNAYEMLTLVLTVLSLVIMVMLFLPLPDATLQVLTVYDNLICVMFLVDFCLRISRAASAKHYFFREGGWLDLLGSVPSFGAFRYAGLLRLARLGRLARITRLLRGQRGKEMMADVLAHRGQYAAFITVTAAFVVLVIASILVLTFESRSGEGNITSGGDALWWAVVTLTTVGYGDTFPMTAGGRITGLFVMFAGVGIIGALASILASVLVTSSESEPEEAAGDEAAAAPVADTAVDPAAGVATMPPSELSPELRDELRAIRAELAAVRKALGDSGAV